MVIIKKFSKNGELLKEYYLNNEFQPGLFICHIQHQTYETASTIFYRMAYYEGENQLDEIEAEIVQEQPTSTIWRTEYVNNDAQSHNITKIVFYGILPTRPYEPKTFSIINTDIQVMPGERLDTLWKVEWITDADNSLTEIFLGNMCIWFRYSDITSPLTKISAKLRIGDNVYTITSDAVIDETGDNFTRWKVILINDIGNGTLIETQGKNKYDVVYASKSQNISWQYEEVKKVLLTINWQQVYENINQLPGILEVEEKMQGQATWQIQTYTTFRIITSTINISSTQENWLRKFWRKIFGNLIIRSLLNKFSIQIKNIVSGLRVGSFLESLSCRQLLSSIRLNSLLEKLSCRQLLSSIRLIPVIEIIWLNLQRNLVSVLRLGSTLTRTTWQGDKEIASKIGISSSLEREVPDFIDDWRDFENGEHI